MTTSPRPGAPAATARPLAEQPAAQRWTPAGERELAARLLACRRELLAIGLLDPAAGAVLDSMAADVDERALRIGAMLDLHGATPEAGRERLEALRAELARLPAGDPEAPDGLEALLERRRALVQAIPLGWDGTERMLQHTWVRAARADAALPSAWQRRVRELEAEIEGLIGRFVAAHRALVGSLARRYRGLGLSREDLEQEGYIGLLRAIEKYDLAREVPFGSYASWWIRQAMRHALTSQSRTIRIPASALATRVALGRASARLAQELGREPSEQELALAAGVAPQSVGEILRWTREPLSLEAPRGEDSSSTLADRVTDPEARSANDDVVAKDSAAHLYELLGRLTPREQRVLERRFGLHGEDEQTLEEIGRSLDLTRERVRQIVAKALARLQLQTRHQQLEL